MLACGVGGTGGGHWRDFLGGTNAMPLSSINHLFRFTGAGRSGYAQTVFVLYDPQAASAVRDGGGRREECVQKGALSSIFSCQC